MKREKEKAKSLKSKTVVLVVTGSIAAVKSGDLIQALKQEGARVICVLTPSAKHFVTPLVLQSFNGERVYEDFFSSYEEYPVLHTSLCETADAILVAPASANFIARAAAGLADDLASCLLLAAGPKPVFFAPAMNDFMYEHPLTQANIQKLKSIGYRFVEPIEGHLVCGKEAIGHISDAATIVASVKKVLGK